MSFNSAVRPYTQIVRQIQHPIRTNQPPQRSTRPTKYAFVISDFPVAESMDSPLHGSLANQVGIALAEHRTCASSMVRTSLGSR